MACKHKKNAFMVVEFINQTLFFVNVRGNYMRAVITQKWMMCNAWKTILTAPFYIDAI